MFHLNEERHQVRVLEHEVDLVVHIRPVRRTRQQPAGMRATTLVLRWVDCLDSMLGLFFPLDYGEFGRRESLVIKHYFLEDCVWKIWKIWKIRQNSAEFGRVWQNLTDLPQ